MKINPIEKIFKKIKLLHEIMNVFDASKYEKIFFCEPQLKTTFLIKPIEIFKIIDKLYRIVQNDEVDDVSKKDLILFNKLWDFIVKMPNIMVEKVFLNVVYVRYRIHNFKKFYTDKNDN